MSELIWLDEELWFPDPARQPCDPDGLIALGGDLSVARLHLAYRSGLFPWFNRPPILWWSPDPRCVISPAALHVSRSLTRILRRQPFRLTVDHGFKKVIEACAQGRAEGTWITPAMKKAYLALHQAGLAHSFEAWTEDGELAGGLYGVAIGRCFFGESMFCRVTNASKVVFVHWVKQLEAWGYQLIDCQIENPHLRSLGADLLSRDQFLSILRRNVDKSPEPHDWHLEWLWPTGTPV